MSVEWFPLEKPFLQKFNLLSSKSEEFLYLVCIHEKLFSCEMKRMLLLETFRKRAQWECFYFSTQNTALSMESEMKIRACNLWKIGKIQNLSRDINVSYTYTSPCAFIRQLHCLHIYPTKSMRRMPLRNCIRKNAFEFHEIYVTKQKQLEQIQ